jgi:hypothetical protein
MNKKAIAILGLIFFLIVGTLGVLIYSRYFNKPEPQKLVENNPPPEDNTPLPTTTPEVVIPVVSESKYIKLTDGPVLSPILYFNGNGVTYFDREGRVWQSSFNLSSTGKLEMIDIKAVNLPPRSNIYQVHWPPATDSYMAEFRTLGKKTWSYFNSLTGAFTDLPEQITSWDWMPDGKQIIYIWLDNGKATLNMGNPDSSNWKEISELWEPDNEIKVSPDGLNILFYRTNNSEAVNGISLTTPDGKIWRSLVKEGYNFGAKWSPDSRKFLFAKRDRNTQKYQLWNYDLYTSEVRNLGLFTTVEKAVWDKSGRYVYAAVPQEGAAEDGALTVDKIFRVDVQTGQFDEFDPKDLKVDAREMSLNSEGDKLFFRNAQDGGLYYVDLTK